MCRAIRITNFICFACLFSCSEEHAPVLGGTFETMGTSVYVLPKGAVAVVEEVFNRVDCEMSEWKNESALSKVNRAAGRSPLECSQELTAVVAFSLEIAERTDGAFDPTWACMGEFWDFKNPKVPSEQEVQGRMHLVNWENVKVTHNTVYLKDKGMKIGLGGIAKGVALDKARDTLLSQGMNNFMLQCGGQVLVQGSERTVGIRKPDGLPDEIIGKVSIKNQSISTSGNYERYFEVDDVRYHHIIDPRTGYPAKGMKSVTVISDNAALGDALSTALFVLGTNKGLELVERTEGVEVLFIDSENMVHTSSGFYLE